MGRLQATWSHPGALFFWTPDGSFDDAVTEELPELAELCPDEDVLTVISAGPPLRRKKVKGWRIEVGKVLSLLPALRNDPNLSDSIRCWSMAARLGLEFGSRQAVAPGVRDTEARWRVLLNRRQDRQRFDDLVEALPAVARMVPTRDSGPVRLATSASVVRAFLDDVADSLYRCNVWPGPARGWVLEFADGLRTENPSFNPRDARSQGIPGKLAGWAAGDGSRGLRLGMTMQVPTGSEGRFHLDFWLHAAHDPAERLPMDEAWFAGESVQVGGRAYGHPAFAALRGLARAKRIFPPISAALGGRAPSSLTWGPVEAWRFLAEGVGPLQDAGFEVELPEAFSQAGSRRIRARMRIEAAPGVELDLSSMLTYRWEVVLGDLILDGDDFAELLEARQPIVRFKGEWILIDPAELERLPAQLPKVGTLDAASALRAVLTGQHEGIPVVADDRLSLVIDALRAAPERPVPPDLHAVLRPYQQRGYEWLACLGDLGLGSCLADDMGLGKTVQLIAHLVDRHGRGPGRKSLVVCPTSVMGNWTRELARFAPGLKVARHHGLQRDLGDALKADVVLTTYGLLARDIDALAAVRWEVAALDEAQAIKNPESQRARAACQLDARHRVALSGTPVENRLDELWSLMRYLVPGLLGTRAGFRRTVAIPVERFGDTSIAHRLRLGVSPFLLRRVKTDPTIVDDLPDKVERREYAGLTGEQASLYREVSEGFLERIAEVASSERRGQVLAMLTALKQVCNHPDQYLKEGGPLKGRSGKLERATELLHDVIEAGDHAIVFTQYREMGDRLVTHLANTFGLTVPFLHGGVPMHKRDEMVRAFQEDADVCPILLISLRAGGTGLNLTRATHVVHFDRWWNPAVEDQATDRAYRIGQHRNVQVHKFVCQGTLEERIDKLLEEKRGLAESVVGSGESLVTELDDAALRALVALGDDALVEDE